MAGGQRPIMIVIVYVLRVRRRRIDRHSLTVRALEESTRRLLLPQLPTLTHHVITTAQNAVIVALMAVTGVGL